MPESYALRIAVMDMNIAGRTLTGEKMATASAERASITAVEWTQLRKLRIADSIALGRRAI